MGISKEIRAKLPKGMKIVKGVSIHSVSKTPTGYTVVEGENKYQDFVEYWKNGRERGMILRLKSGKFWQVWIGSLVVTIQRTSKGGARSWEVIGSPNKQKALTMMRRRLSG